MKQPSKQVSATGELAFPVGGVYANNLASEGLPSPASQLLQSRRNSLLHLTSSLAGAGGSGLIPSTAEVRVQPLAPLVF